MGFEIESKFSVTLMLTRAKWHVYYDGFYTGNAEAIFSKDF